MALRPDRELGTASKLWRYPVKSMLGEECEHLDLDARGVAGDRLFAVRDAAGKLGSGKDSRRFRQIDGLFGLRAACPGPVPEIAFPDGRRLRADDPRIDAALSEVLALPVTLGREERISHLDSGPVHLVTTASLAWLRTHLPDDARIDERRFRPNLLIAVPGDTPIEQSWIGKTLRIGDEVRLRVTDPTERCRMVTLAQADLPSDPQVLRAIGRDADLQFGVYAEVVAPGRIKRNDSVTYKPAGCGKAA